MNQEQRRVYLIKRLLKENPQYSKIIVPPDKESQKLLLRALFNVRLPKKIDFRFKFTQDQYLKEENNAKGIVETETFPKGISIWKGDITRLKVDAIVNAANSGMTGCYQPNHACIDNAIHTFSGIELRNKCNEMMEKQGHLEATGQAKITPGYNLPAKYVIHTVGPIVENEVTPEKEDLLRSSYLNSLKLAEANNVKSIAFPCISTGIFNFPNKRAAEIAYETVSDHLKQRSKIERVIFNVFKEEDRRIYQSLLESR